MDKPLVSIVVPVYNAEDYLNRCIESIINQSYNNIEIILVDDGSTDESCNICYKYKNIDKRIRVIQISNSGSYSARKVGFKKSKGDYLCFVDSDDWIDIDFIKKMVEIAKEYNCDIVKAGIIRDFQNNRKSQIKKIPYKEDILILKDDYNKNLYPKLIKSNFFNSMCCELIRKEIIDFNDNKKIRMGEDLKFNLNIISKSKKIYILKEYLYHYVYNQSSITVKADYDYINKNMLDVIYVYGFLESFLKDNNVNSSLIKRINRKKALEYINQSKKFFYQKEIEIKYNNYYKIINIEKNNLNANNSFNIVFITIDKFPLLIYLYLYMTISAKKIIKNLLRR